jgi:hypothetical protein
LNHICGGIVEVLSNGDGRGLHNLKVVSGREKKTSSKKEEKQLILYVRYIDYGLASA